MYFLKLNKKFNKNTTYQICVFRMHGGGVSLQDGQRGEGLSAVAGDVGVAGDHAEGAWRGGGQAGPHQGRRQRT